MVTPAQERWAEALAVINWKNEKALQYADQRMRELDASGDLAGVARWRQIAERINALIDAPSA